MSKAKGRESLIPFPRPKTYEPGFERHAAPEAIKAHIDQARKKLEQVQHELGWLEGFFLRRSAEKAAGTWPYSDKVNSACVNENHGSCTGMVYIGHANDRPNYGACECRCHV